MTFYLLCLGLEEEKKKDCKSQNQKGSIINMGLKMCSSNNQTMTIVLQP